MTLATYELAVDWGRDGAYAGDDIITSDVLHIRCKRGRDIGNQLTGRSIAGEMTVLLRNRTGKYSPFNTASAIYGNIKPRRKVRLRTTAPSVSVIWTGFLDRINPLVSSGKRTTYAQLRAFGSLSVLTETEVQVAMKTSRGTGAAIGDVLDGISWAAGDRDIDTGITTMDRWWTDRQKALSASREIELSESGFLRENEDEKIVFEDRHRRLKPPYTTSQATFSDALGATLPYDDVQEIDSAELLNNDFRGEVVLYDVEALAVLWTHPEANTAGDAPLIPPGGGSITFFARYPNPQSPTDALAVDAWTTPVATTDFTVNSSAAGTGTNITGSIAVAVTKYSESMLVTLTNNHATIAGHLTFMQARGTAVTSRDPVPVRSVDATSQTTFGPRVFPRDSEAQWVPSTNEMQDWCDFHKSIYKDEIALLSMVYSAHGSSGLMTEALARDISDRVTIVANEAAKLGINGDYFIESVEHSITPERKHTVTYLLSDASRYGGFFILDSATFGILDTNKLGY